MSSAVRLSWRQDERCAAATLNRNVEFERGDERERTNQLRVGGVRGARAIDARPPATPLERGDELGLNADELTIQYIQVHSHFNDSSIVRFHPASAEVLRSDGLSRAGRFNHDSVNTNVNDRQLSTTQSQYSSATFTTVPVVPTVP